jgi:hypothetical protein
MIEPRKTKKASKDRFIGTTDEKVGYAQPPVASRFKPGKSGNPKGRPKRARTFEEAIEQELNSLMTVREGGIERRMPKYQVLAKKTVADAIAGKTGSAKQLTAALEKLAVLGVTKSPEEIAALTRYRALVRDLLDDGIDLRLEIMLYRKWIGPISARMRLAHDASPRSMEKTADLERRAKLEPPLVLYQPQPGDLPMRKAAIERWFKKPDENESS